MKDLQHWLEVRNGELDMNVHWENANIYDLGPEKYVITVLRWKGMRVLVLGNIITSRKLAAAETWTDLVDGAWFSRVEMKTEM